MTIEQKAKCYDDALKMAKKLYEQGTITESLAYIFPELKESEDENYQKILDELKYFMPGYDGTGISYEDPDWVITLIEEKGTISFYGTTFDEALVQAYNYIK